MKVTRRLLPLLLVLGTLPLASHGVGEVDAHDWIAPAVAAPGLEIQGNPHLWSRTQAKALDPVYDGAEGRAARGDLMGFYYDQEIDRLNFRVNLFREAGVKDSAPVLDPGVRAIVLMDYAPGGTKALPDGIAGEAPFAWDRAVELTENGGTLTGRILDDRGDARETERLRSVRESKSWDMLEGSLWLPGGFAEAAARAAGKPAADYDAVAARAAADDATPVRFYVITTDGSRVLDSITATNAPTSSTHNVAFVQHLNQGLTYTTVFRGERGENAAYDGDPNNPDDGADELLAAHQYYNLPVNWHQAGTLISAAQWHDKSFNDWLAAGVTGGWVEMITSAYGQQMMPFLRDEVNGKAVAVENSMIVQRYGFTPRVAWVPERVWCENPDNDGNGHTASGNVIDYIGDNFTNNGIWAVILDDYIHCGYNDNTFNDHHIYTYNGLKVLPIDNDFVGQVNYDWGAAWNTILAGTSDEIIIYGNDAEIAAEVSQGAGNPDALNNYIHVLQQCSANSGVVGVWKLTDVLQDPGFTTQSITLQSGTYGLLGGFDGYGGGNNFWYGDWAGYTGSSNLDNHVPKLDYGTQWNNALDNILAAPVNNLSEMAWYILVTNLHETGWHDNGEISGWENHYSNHIRSANPHAEAARWAAGLYANPTGAYLSDIDDDGVDELVMYNDRLMAVFDTIGGKLQWLFCKGVDYNYSVVSNDNAYWADTDGDYNETNHVAALSDVSVNGTDREGDLYGLQVLSGAGNTVSAELTAYGISKTVSLTLGDPYLDVVYRADGNRVYVKSGMSPDLLDMTWSGTLDRVWDPDGGGYFGQKNPDTDATAAIVVGSAGAHHNLQFSATLLEGDELYGDSPFEVYLYGGYTSALDGNGHVPELKALRDGLTDTIGPSPTYGVYYPGTDHLTLYFDEAVQIASVVQTGFAVDDNDDGTAEVTLTGSETLTTGGTSSKRLDFDLTPGTASALEALNTSSLELLLAAGSVQDASSNPNLQITNLDNVAINFTPPTAIQIDGLINAADWSSPRWSCEDFWDSAWNSSAPGDTNEINALYVDWDDTYLYLGVLGRVQGNSWLLYLDADLDGPNGYTDLTAIDAWERGASFSGPGFRPDFQLGAYQHQGSFDGQSFWRLTGPTTSTDLSSQVIMAFDPQHLNGNNGGSELAIPWDVIYGLGPGTVPAGAKIAVVASVCWDPEPDGELGGDVCPNNVSATLPQVDNFCAVTVDVDGNGLPDPKNITTGAPPDAGPSGIRVRAAFPNPAMGPTAVPLVLAGPAQGGKDHYNVRAEVFDLSGRRVRVLYSGSMPAGEHALRWDGRTESGVDAGAGIFFTRVVVDGKNAGTSKITRVP